MKDTFPQGWAAAPLRDFVDDVRSGFASGKKSVEGGVAHLRMNNIGPKGKLVLDLVRKVPNILAQPQHQLQNGDVLICTTNSGALVGKCALFDLSGRYVFSNHLTRLRPKPQLLDGNFLRWNLWLHWQRGTFDDKCKHWVNQSALPKDALLSTEIAVAPLPEQRRIVAKLDQLLSKVDACQKRLDNILTILKRFRQGVFAAASSGRLTAEWREKNSEVEPTCELIRRINEARRASAQPKLTRTEQDAQLRAVEVVSDKEGLELIPDTWTWVRFGSVIAQLRNGVSPRPNVEPPGVPILRISAVRRGSVDLLDIRHMPAGDDFLPLFAVHDGDLLFTRYNGSIELLGVCGMVRGLGKKTLLYPDKLMRVRSDHSLILPGYAEIFFQAPEVHERIIANSKSSAGQNGVSGSDIKNQPFALPPLPEQQEIVRRVESLFALASRIEARYAKAKIHVDKVTQSILTKAFRGELVPTEAELAEAQGRNFNSAERLLQRVTTTRAAKKFHATPAIEKSKKGYNRNARA